MAPYPFWTQRPQSSLTGQSLFQSTGNPPTQTGTSTSTHITTSNTSVRLPEPYSIGPSTDEEKISETQRVITKLNANGYSTSVINSCQPSTHHNNRPPGDFVQQNATLLCYHTTIATTATTAVPFTSCKHPTP